MSRSGRAAPVNQRHQQAPRSLLQPDPGLYRVRLIKGGPLVAAAIEYGPSRDPDAGDVLDRSWYWQAIVNGQPVGDPEIRPGDTVWQIHEYGERIEQHEYDYLVSLAQWAAEHKPSDPMANPRKPIDLMTTDLPF